MQACNCSHQSRREQLDCNTLDDCKRLQGQLKPYLQIIDTLRKRLLTRQVDYVLIWFTADLDIGKNHVSCAEREQGY